MVQVEINPQFDDYAGLLALLHKSFAYMDGRIDPPSSLHKLDVDGLSEKAKAETLLTAVDVARQLVDVANLIGKQWSCQGLELECRVELGENQSFFTHLGFKKVGENAHKGYDQATSFKYRRVIL